jgi:hypothetical protein
LNCDVQAGMESVDGFFGNSHLLFLLISQVLFLQGSLSADLHVLCNQMSWEKLSLDEFVLILVFVPLPMVPPFLDEIF